MPLIVISGQPSSGKSTVVQSLAKRLEDKQQEVVVVDEPGLLLKRDESYKDAVCQKNTRGSLRSAVERAVTKTAVVILDSINNIKGFRYELWCIARTAGTRYCVIHVDTKSEVCESWNKDREGDKYSDEILEDLLRSFETPDSRNRWDHPLFTVKPAIGEIEVPLTAAVNAILGINDQNSRGSIARNLTPTLATVNASLSATNTQYEIDKAAQTVLDEVVRAQSEAGGEAAGIVEFEKELPTLRLDRHVTVAELRRLKRGFLKLATQIQRSRVTDSQSAKRLFIGYLENGIQ
ncbi:hypothetical protein BSKO_11161 [Bryopsis sp. KO-2023]|nr:hypothetical protein BSKO_11161 [Bryopsis sp. KO-2023]